MTWLVETASDAEFTGRRLCVTVLKLRYYQCVGGKHQKRQRLKLTVSVWLALFTNSTRYQWLLPPPCIHISSSVFLCLSKLLVKLAKQDYEISKEFGEIWSKKENKTHKTECQHRVFYLTRNQQQSNKCTCNAKRRNRKQRVPVLTVRFFCFCFVF